MINVTYDKLEAIAKKKGYRWFTAVYDLNFVGIRSMSTTPDVFDDTIAIAYKDKSGNKRVFLAPFTCDPGLYYLQNPINGSGTAIIPEGQYLGLWIYGKHKGYNALVQRIPIKVLRDANRNNTIEGKLTNAAEMGGFNFHRALENDITMTVGKFSAGCQVVQTPEDFRYILSLVLLQVKYIKSAIVSYTLISERDVTSAS